MSTTPKEFLLYGATLMGALVLYMLYRPKKKSPVKLQLDKTSELWSKEEESSVTLEDADEKEVGRDLSVIFQFNGHSFEAFEVLGLPAGSSPAQVEAAYLKAKATADPESLEFIELAYRSLLRHHSN